MNCIVRAVVLLPLAHNLAIHLPLFRLEPLDHDDHGVAHHEVGVLVLVGVVAHADGAVGQIAEHAAAVLAGDGGVPAAVHGVALLRTVEGIGLGGLHRDLEVVLVRVEGNHFAVQLLAGVVFLPQVGDGGVPQLPLGEIDVMAVALHQAAPGPHGQHPALDLGADPVQ